MPTLIAQASSPATRPSRWTALERRRQSRCRIWRYFALDSTIRFGGGQSSGQITFARIGAVAVMRVSDYYPVGKRWWVRLHEKGGKEHTMPAHHTLQEWLDAYLMAAGIGDDKKEVLFRTAEKRSGQLTEKPLAQADAYSMVQRRAAAANVATRIGCHSWRARGITAYLENGGLLEHAQQMAAHSSARTTKLYDRRGEGRGFHSMKSSELASSADVVSVEKGQISFAKGGGSLRMFSTHECVEITTTNLPL